MSNNYECQCDNCKYVSKKEIKEYKHDFEIAIESVRKDLKSEYEKSCNSMLVGSARRNLVVQKGESHWDVDYQFLFTSPVYDDENKIKPYELKNFIKEEFQDILGEDYSVKMSKSVITICLKDDEGNHAIKSFDIALIRESDNKILRGKNNDSSSKDYVRWEELPNPSSIYERRREIKGQDMWKKFREIFIKKKCENMDKEKEEQKPTYSLYVETIKETLESFGVF